MQQHETDYLVIGSGAAGMAFVDTLLDESDASVLIVDDHHQPGGHWNDAYPFVRLHQPSHFYGVASADLGSARIDESGSNAGFFELATGAEVQSYFERLMRQRFLPSGRVQYFSMCHYDGEGEFHNVVSGERHHVKVNKRVVDSTFFKTTVPSRHVPNFEVEDGVTCVPPNQLPLLAGKHAHFCVVGAGKTAMDVGVWLLDQAAQPNAISWVCPRRSWMINREVTQGHAQFFRESIGGFANQLEAMAEAESIDDLFLRLEAVGYMVRVDKSQMPEMFHYATISIGEVEQLRRIEHVLDQGRVAQITTDGLTFQDGSQQTMPPQTLYIDCTASAVDFTSTASRPVYEPGLITIQAMRVPNPCLSAAMIAYVECRYDTDEARNKLCTPVFLPDTPRSWVDSMLGNMTNQVTWSAEPELQKWIGESRLDGFSAVIQAADHNDPEQKNIVDRLSAAMLPAFTNLQKLSAGS